MSARVTRYAATYWAIFVSTKNPSEATEIHVCVFVCVHFGLTDLTNAISKYKIPFIPD